MPLFAKVFLLLWFVAAQGMASPPTRVEDLKPAMLKRAVEERELFASAKLKDDTYVFNALGQVNRTHTRARAVITDFKSYPKWISYIDRFEPHSTRPGQYLLEGGVLGFKLISTVAVDQSDESSIGFEIVEGHLLGLKGKLEFLPQKKKGTLLFISGVLKSSSFPPAFILERGGEIVLTAAAGVLRKQIESEKEPRP